jgi:N-formylglutamate amidohydrolase
MQPLFTFQAGKTPLLINVPHAGIAVPEDIRVHFSPAASGLPDTDWFVDKLYGWATQLGAGILSANYSRYVIDLNRPPDDAALYQRAGTSLVPENTFSGESIYLQGLAPDSLQVELRKKTFWQPYHDKLALEMQHIRQRHGYAILVDAHSILSHVPMLFDGKLPDLNLGSNRSNSANEQLIDLSMRALSSSPDYTSVLDGRFQGGYITRHYGQPENGWHALQLEMAQSVYMQENPPQYDHKRAAGIRPVLESWLTGLLQWAPDNG